MRRKRANGGGAAAAAAPKKSAKGARAASMSAKSPRQDSDDEDSDESNPAPSEDSGDDDAPKATPKAPKTPKTPKDRMAESLHQALLEAIAACKNKPYNKGTCMRVFCLPRRAAPSDTYPTPCPTLFPYSHAADDKADFGAAEAEQHVS